MDWLHTHGRHTAKPSKFLNPSVPTLFLRDPDASGESGSDLGWGNYPRSFYDDVSRPRNLVPRQRERLPAINQRHADVRVNVVSSERVKSIVPVRCGRLMDEGRGRTMAICECLEQERFNTVAPWRRS